MYSSHQGAIFGHPTGEGAAEAAADQASCSVPARRKAEGGSALRISDCGFGRRADDASCSMPDGGIKAEGDSGLQIADCGLSTTAVVGRACWTPDSEADPERVKMVTLGFVTEGPGRGKEGRGPRSDCVRKMVTLVFRTDRAPQANADCGIAFGMGDLVRQFMT